MACATIVGPFTVVAHPGPDLEDDHLVIPIRLDSFTRNIPNNLGGMLKTIARICPQVRVVDGPQARPSFARSEVAWSLPLRSSAYNAL